MNQVTPKGGTRIAHERTGKDPPGSPGQGIWPHHR